MDLCIYRSLLYEPSYPRRPNPLYMLRPSIMYTHAWIPHFTFNYAVLTPRDGVMQKNQVTSRQWIRPLLFTTGRSSLRIQHYWLHLHNNFFFKFYLRSYLVVTWLVPRETAAISTSLYTMQTMHQFTVLFKDAYVHLVFFFFFILK